MKGVHPPWKSSSTAHQRGQQAWEEEEAAAKFSSPFAAEFQAAA